MKQKHLSKIIEINLFKQIHLSNSVQEIRRLSMKEYEWKTGGWKIEIVMQSWDSQESFVFDIDFEQAQHQTEVPKLV